MKNQNYRSEIPIREQIKKLGSQFIEGKNLNIQIKTSEDNLNLIDTGNPEHRGTQFSVSTTMKTAMNFVMCLFCYSMDFAVVYNAVALFCTGILLPVLRAVIPLGFVGAEIWISYMVIEREAAGEHMSWLEKNLKYLVITFLVAFSVLAIIYSIVGYKSGIDQGSYTLHIAYTVFCQLFLLAPAIALHLWIIKHALDIYETFSRFLFKSTRRKPERKHRRYMEKRNKFNVVFVRSVYTLVEMVARFTERFEVSADYFTCTMSLELINAINTVMGRTIFDPKQSKRDSNVVQ